jgi:nicotinamidase-related amidase
MPELSHIDPRSPALLVIDYQVDTLTRFMTAAQSADAVACVPRLIATAREAGMMAIHVVVAFRPDRPEVSPRRRGRRCRGRRRPGLSSPSASRHCSRR